MKTIKSFFTILVPLFSLSGCKTIINQMAFHPDTKNVIPSNKLPSNIKELFIQTEDNLKIHSYFIPNKSSGKILIYFHGNAGNICHRLPDLLKINESGVNVLGVSYRGYGKSDGEPDEATGRERRGDRVEGHHHVVAPPIGLRRRLARWLHELGDEGPAWHRSPAVID